MTASYLINRTPSKLLNGQTPFERLYLRSPPLTHLRVFGCLCYAHNQNHRGDKFDSRSVQGVFIGSPTGKKGWRVLNPDTGKIFVSRDVVFCETEFPYANRSVLHTPMITPITDTSTTPVTVSLQNEEPSPDPEPDDIVVVPNTTPVLPDATPSLSENYSSSPASNTSGTQTDLSPTVPTDLSDMEGSLSLPSLPSPTTVHDTSVFLTYLLICLQT